MGLCIIEEVEHEPIQEHGEGQEDKHAGHKPRLEVWTGLRTVQLPYQQGHDHGHGNQVREAYKGLEPAAPLPPACPATAGTIQHTRTKRRFEVCTRRHPFCFSFVCFKVVAR